MTRKRKKVLVLTCDHFDGDDKEFSKIVKEFCELDGRYRFDLAYELEAAPSSLVRWGQGVSYPRKEIMEYAVKAIKKILAKK